MKIKLITSLLLGSVILLNASNDGAKLLEEKCATCHFLSSSKNKMVAPPMWGVTKTVNTHFKTQEESMEFIMDYTMNPSEDKMVFPVSTKKLFGLMPSMKDKLTKDELRTIVEYLYP